MIRIFFIALFFLSTTVVGAQGILPSWNETQSKRDIVSFVERTTRADSPDYVAPAARIAVFDNDGTLWSEQPMYVQVAFMIDRIKALAAENPSWITQQPFKAVLENDSEALRKAGDKGLVQLFLATHAGMSSDEFHAIVLDWLKTARHPQSGRPYTEMVYQPMLELLDYLRENGFKTFIVSGGGVEFIRPWAQSTYGIPPEQVVGSSLKGKFEMKDGRATVTHLPEINFVNDKAGKPVAIDLHIGRRPVMAFGNSDGDLEMLQWTSSGQGARFGLIVHHTDNVREVAYDRDSSIGKLNVALDQANQYGWTVVDMKSDWRTVFPSN
jgi:phosphoserine phosphatase